MPECPKCKKPMDTKQWTQRYDVAICEVCKIRKYWDRTEQGFATHKEIMEIKKIWE